MSNERSPLQEIGSEKEDENASLRPYLIQTFPADFTLEVLVDKWVKKEIRKEGFQRRYIWEIDRASKLIESFLLGLPVPPVYLYKDRKDAGLLIVDGHQRLRTIAYFFSGWFGDEEEMDPKKIVPFKLVGLHEDSPYSGASFASIANTDPVAFNNFKNSVLRSFLMQQIEPDDDTSMFEIFSRLNTGGITLHPQEIRNCVCAGVFNENLKKLNENLAWRQIFGVKKEDKRMRDVELILRFLALYGDVKSYKKPMKDFLNKFMDSRKRRPVAREEDSEAVKKTIATKAKAYDAEQLKFASLFQKTAELVLKYLGAKPFHVKSGLNAAAFDSIFTAFAKHFAHLEVDVVNPTPREIAQVRERYSALLHDENYQAWIYSSTTDKEVVPNRINIAQAVLFGAG
jgi:hypothetical protein